MKDKLISVGVILAIIVSFVALGKSGALKSNGQGLFGATSAGTLLAENYIPYVLYNGGYNSAKDVSTTAGLFGLTLDTTSTITETNTGTSTIKSLSSSATKGFCLQFNATSTNTLLNMTFSATTTALTTNTTAAGVIPNINYGACL